MIGLEKSRGGRTNRRVSLQTSCFPVVSHGTTLCAVITSCFSFRYNKQLIAQLVGRHEDLSLEDLSSGDMNFLGGTNLHVSLQTGQ